MKKAAFVLGLMILAFGLFGLASPGGLVWIARRVLNPAAFLVIAAVRLGFGFMLIKTARETRSPRVIRVLGVFIFITGVVTAGLAAFGMELAARVVEGWASSGGLVLRLTGLPVTALGSFVAWACTP
jgi:hypothetical protein